MGKGCRIYSLMLILAGLVLLATPLSALAVYEITLSGAGIATFTCVNGTACDMNPAADAITVILGAGGAPVPAGLAGGTNTAITISGFGTSTLDLGWTLNSGGLAGNTGNPLIVIASNTGYTQPAGGVATLVTQVNGNYASGSGSTTANAWANLANANFTVPPVTGAHCGPLGPFTTDGFGASCSTTFAVTTPYSLNDQLNLELAANSASSGDMFIRVTPEPATILLIGAGLLGAAAWGTRRRSR